MKKSTRILALVWVLALLASPAFAGHALNSPVATTNPGDFWVSGNMDCDGTAVFDDVCTFNANAIFTLAASFGTDLTITGDVSCDSLYAGTNVTVAATLAAADVAVSDDLTVTGDATISGDLKGARVWLTYGISSSNETADKWFTVGSAISTTARGAPATAAGSVRRYAVRYNIDSFSLGAYAVTRFYINGAKTFADSFYINSTGWHEDHDVFARDTYTFSAGDYFSVQFDINGTLQYDVPLVTLDLQLDE